VPVVILGINRLELRRLHADLILCYKIIHGYVSLSPDSFFTVLPVSEMTYTVSSGTLNRSIPYRTLLLFVINRTRGHSLKLFVPDARVNCRKHFFAVRMINVWNSLPDKVVSTNQLSRFKTHIKQIDLNNFLIRKA